MAKEIQGDAPEPLPEGQTDHPHDELNNQLFGLTGEATLTVDSDGGIFVCNTLPTPITIDIANQALEANFQLEIKVIETLDSMYLPQLEPDERLCCQLIHFLPHGYQFKERVTVYFALEMSSYSAQQAPEYKILYSPTAPGEPPAWRDVSSTCEGTPEGLVLLPHRKAVVILETFCIFTVIEKDTGAKLEATCLEMQPRVLYHKTPSNSVLTLGLCFCSIQVSTNNTV